MWDMKFNIFLALFYLTSQIQLEFVTDPSLCGTPDHSIASLDKLPLILAGYIAMINFMFSRLNCKW